GAPGGRGGRARQRERGLLPRRQGEHPDPRRDGLHLGVRLPPPLPPGQAPRAPAPERSPLGGAPDHPERGAGPTPSRFRRRPRGGRGLSEVSMDFTDTKEEAGFRAEARSFLAASAEPKRGTFETWQSRYGDYEGLGHAKAFQAKKADAGFAALAWPAEWGGRG